MVESKPKHKSNKMPRNSIIGGGNTNGDSDNSGFSLGNNSFGFNFDSEEGPSPSNSDAGAKSDEDAGSLSKLNTHLNNPMSSAATVSTTSSTITSKSQASKPQQLTHQPSATPTTTNISNAQIPTPMSLTHEAAAAATMAQLQTIASRSIALSVNQEADLPTSMHDLKSSISIDQSKKRKSHDTMNGYKSDNEYTGGSLKPPMLALAPASTTPAKIERPELMIKGRGTTDQQPILQTKKKKLDEIKREERNAREKERSYRITSQITELRNLLSSGGVIVPKGTKNAVLTEAANYIRLLQQHQYKSELHRQQLIQQMQLIGSGQLGPQAANAIRHVAAQNGVWSLGNFGGVPPRSAMVPAQQSSLDDSHSPDSSGIQVETSKPDQPSKPDQLLNDIEVGDYRFVFNSCVIGMAIASMGGAFIDCNQLFIQLSEYTKQEICGLTIFNLTAREDLQNAFELISRMISPPVDSVVNAPACVLRGNMKNRSDLGLNITLIKDSEGIAKCFCVSLIKNPASPFDESAPSHATAALIKSSTYDPQSALRKTENMLSPTFMTG